ncbi:hypothetical protein DFQ28_009079 [Apophysomyces sp. BC1034]|nr:hypothetical protein DFQ29_010084 [Apophysomyces sp. BC1021]KAG0192468.1 hypothetical protein DFQ28_009079 [Apophysomyces sp. BC1034]
MKCGVSSILNLVDYESVKQLLAYDDQEWNDIVQKFDKKYAVAPVDLNPAIETAWDTVVALVNHTNSTTKTKKYLNNLTTNDLEDFTFSNGLDIVAKNSFLWNEDNTSKVTESDFLMNVWCPLIKFFVAIHSVLRMKT